MPVADPSFGWHEAAAAFAIISVVAFLVSWVVTDLGRVSRTPYVAILALTTFALAGGYLAWSGTSVVDLVTDELGLGPSRGCRGRRASHAAGAAPAREASSWGRSARRTVPVGRGGLRDRGGDPSRHVAGARHLAGHRCARLDGHWTSEGPFGRACGSRLAVRDRGAPPRIPGVPAEGFQEDAGGRADGVRHPGVGLPSHGERARPGRRPHRSPLAVDAAGERDASRVEASAPVTGHRSPAYQGHRPSELVAWQRTIEAPALLLLIRLVGVSSSAYSFGWSGSLPLRMDRRVRRAQDRFADVDPFGLH